MNARDYRPSFIKGAMEREDLKQPQEPRKCIMCPKMVPQNSRWYCSGWCVIEARDKGVYDHEEEWQ